MDSLSPTEFLTRAARAQFLVVDVETNGKDVREPDNGFYVQGVALAFRDKDGLHGHYFALAHTQGENLEKPLQGDLCKVISEHPCIVGYNFLKFDELALYRGLDITVTGNVYDLMSMAHWVNENLTKHWSLDNVCHLYHLPTKNKSAEMTSLIENFGWGAVSAEMMREYATNDGIIEYKLFEKLYPMFVAQGFVGELWFKEQKFLRTLAMMETIGVRIDRKFCTQEIKIGEMRKTDILWDLEGRKPSSPKDLEWMILGELGLPLATDALGKPMLTPGGKPSFDKNAMREYDEMLEKLDNPLAKLVTEYRGWDKTVSSNYRAYLEYVGNDGRLRCNYKHTGTVTGRLSCEKPNLQQIPKMSDKRWNGNLKAAFIPEDGYTLWEFDYSNLELRVIAAYCREPRLLEVFEQDLNVFDIMAKDLGYSRNAIKTFYYATSYNAQDPKVASSLGISIQQAHKLRSDFFSTYIRMGKFREEVASAAANRRELKYWTGRKRHFRSSKEGKHLGFNSLIQGGGAELVKDRTIACGDAIDWEDCKLLLQVHDSLVFEVKNGTEDRWLPVIKETMENVPSPLGDVVKFTVDMKRWGEK